MSTKNTMEVLNEIDSNIVLERMLGRGGEGTVYLGRDKVTNEKLIVKHYFEPIYGSPSRALRQYAKLVGVNNYGLPKISLIEKEDKIVGLKYTFTRLHNIHWRIFDQYDVMGKVIFSNFCWMQYHLISYADLALADPAIINFMMSQNGAFHYVDFGYGIKLIQHPHIVDYGRLGYGFAMILADIYNKNIKHDLLPSPGYSHEDPCRYCSYDGLDEIGERHAWVKDIISEVRCQKASIFQSAAFYKSLAKRFPSQVPFPLGVIWASNTLFAAARLKNLLLPR